jgi:hypothetical protein
VQKQPQPTKRARTISQNKGSTRPTYIPLQPPKDLHLIEELVVIMPSTVSIDPSLILKDFTGDLAQHVTHIRIYQRHIDGSYYGHLTLDSCVSHVTNGPFLLGVETDANAYTAQYLEMITEGGRKQPIRITKMKRCESGTTEEIVL